MERLTIESNVFEGHTLKCLCGSDKDGCELYCCEYCNENCNNDCYNCEIQQAFDRLAAYEDTGLTSEEIEALKADNDRLHRLIDELESGLRKENENA